MLIEIIFFTIREEKRYAKDCHDMAMVSRSKGEFTLQNMQLNERDKHLYVANVLKGILDKMEL